MPADSPRLLRRVLRGACKAAIVAVLSVLLLEAALGTVERWQPISPDFFVAAGESPGYKLMPGAHGSYRFGPRRVTVTIDEHGRRLVPAPGPAAAAPAVHLIGDSQVFGWGLADDETIAAKLQELVGPRLRVVNHGLPGAGPYYDLRTLADVPPADVAVVIHAEQNDLWDAYTEGGSMQCRCGLLLPPGQFGAHVPCAAARSYLVHALIDMRDRLFRDDQPLPLSFNPRTVAAARVLAYRVENLYADERLLRGRRLLFGVVPWDGLIDPARRDDYRPRVAEPLRSITWRDDIGLEAAMARCPSPASLFLAGDPHLSAEGAALMARLIAARLREVTADDALGQ